MKKSKIKLIKKITMLLVVTLLIYIGIKLFPWFKELQTIDGRQAFRLELENLGIKGVFILLFLIVAKIVIIFLPGEPLEIIIFIIISEKTKTNTPKIKKTKNEVVKKVLNNLLTSGKRYYSLLK